MENNPFPSSSMSQTFKKKKHFKNWKNVLKVLKPKLGRPELVLDGEHIITEFFKVSNISKGKDIQELEDMKKFLKGTSLSVSHPVTLPAAEEYSCVFNGKSHEIFDNRRVVRKLVVHKGDTKRIGVWNWSGKELKLELEYEFEFKGKIQKIVGLPKKSQILN